MKNSPCLLTSEHNIIYYKTNNFPAYSLNVKENLIDKNIEKTNDFYTLTKKTYIKQEKINKVNIQVEINILNYKKGVYNNQPYIIKNQNNFLIPHLNLSLFLIKHFYLKELRLKKQFVFVLKEYIENLNKSINTIWALETNLILNLNKNFNFISKKIIKNETTLFSDYINSYFSSLNTFPQKNIPTSLNLYSKLSNEILFNNFFFHQYNILNNKTHLFEFKKPYFALNSLLFTLLSDQKGTYKIKNNITFNHLIKRKYLTTLLRNKNHIEISSIILKKFYQNNTNNVKKNIWKENNLSLKTYIYYDNLKKGNFFSKHKLIRRNSYNSFPYTLAKLEEKITILKKNNKETAALEKLRNILVFKWKNKNHRQRGLNLLLSTVRDIRKIKTFKWKKYFKNVVISQLKESKNLKSKTVLKTLLNRILNVEKRTNTVFTQKPSFDKTKYKNFRILPYWRKPLKIQIPFKNKKIILKNDFKEYSNYKDALSLMFGRNVSIFYINAVSLSRFAFKLENGTKNSKAFLENVERELINRYKYVATYIQDLVQISFISLFFKKPTFLAKFVAFQIEKLPRNRKETRLIKFIIKTVKIFAAQRKETLGIRLKFKGRVNRWRRTKSIIGDRGTINLHTHSERIEFGSAKAVTRKGTLGISFWIRYSPYFQNEIEKTIKQYIKYSKLLYAKRIKRFFYFYNNRTQLSK